MTRFRPFASVARILVSMAVIALVGIVVAGCSTETPSGGGQAVALDPPADNETDGGDDPQSAPADGAAADSLHDALSMPASPTLSPANFRSSATCGACHPNHFAQWQTSMHAYATKDPVWRALVAIRQTDFEGQRDQFCIQCHSAIATRGGEVVPGFSFDDFSPIALEGVTCESCHKVAGLERVYNSGHVLDETGPIRGPIEDPVPNGFHESEYSPLHDTSEFCGGCHDVIEFSDLNLERPYEEWVPSPAGLAGRNCQSCHMPSYTGRAASVEGVPERDNLHLHRFIGVDMPLSEDFITDPELASEIRAEVVALLRSAGEIEVQAAASVKAGEQIDLAVTVRNLIDAHNLPTGATFNRQLWVAVTATDAEGNILYQTGHLDDNGDLRNFWSGLDQFGDHDLIELASRFVDERGNPTVFPWKAAEHISNSLSPLFARTFTLFVPTQPDTVGPITVEARLRFRSFPPFLIRALGLDELVSRLEITDIDEQTITVEIAG
ncbi:MAG: cytochrome c family protein [Phycisphaerae bacterium]